MLWSRSLNPRFLQKESLNSICTCPSQLMRGISIFLIQTSPFPVSVDITAKRALMLLKPLQWGPPAWPSVQLLEGHASPAAQCRPATSRVLLVERRESGHRWNKAELAANRSPLWAAYTPSRLLGNKPVTELAQLWRASKETFQQPTLITILPSISLFPRMTYKMQPLWW